MKYNTHPSLTGWFFEEQHEQQQQEQQTDPPAPLTFADEAAARKFFEEKGFKLLTDSDQTAAISQALSKSFNEIDAIVEEKFGIKKDGKKTSDLLRSIEYKKPEAPKPDDPNPQGSTQLLELTKKLEALEKRAAEAETAARTEKVNAAITTGLGSIKIAAPEGAEAVYREVAESAFRSKFTAELKDGKLTFKDAAGVAQVDAAGNPKGVEALFKEHFGPLVAAEKNPAGSGKNGNPQSPDFLGSTKVEIDEALHKKGLVPGSKEHTEAREKAIKAAGIEK